MRFVERFMGDPASKRRAGQGLARSCILVEPALEPPEQQSRAVAQPAPNSHLRTTGELCYDQPQLPGGYAPKMVAASQICRSTQASSRSFRCSPVSQTRSIPGKLLEIDGEPIAALSRAHATLSCVLSISFCLLILLVDDRCTLCCSFLFESIVWMSRLFAIVVAQVKQ